MSTPPHPRTPAESLASKRVGEEESQADYEILRAARERGDAASLARLAERLTFVPRLLRAIDRRRGRRVAQEDIEDLTQDVLVILWRKSEDFRGEGTLERWAYRVCLLEYLNLVRKQGRRRPMTLLDEVDVPDRRPAEAPDDDLRDLLERAFCDLDPPEEEVVRLKLSEELTFTEVGERLGIPPNTAKTRFYRGMERVRRTVGRGIGGSEEAR